MDASRIPQTKREFRFESSGERAGKLRLYHRQQCRFQGDNGPIMSQFESHQQSAPPKSVMAMVMTWAIHNTYGGSL